MQYPLKGVWREMALLGCSNDLDAGDICKCDSVFGEHTP